MGECVMGGSFWYARSSYSAASAIVSAADSIRIHEMKKLANASASRKDQ
jgi:hypothetical protein